MPSSTGPTGTKRSSTCSRRCTHASICTKTEREVILGGDFNAPNRETGDEIVPQPGAGNSYTNYLFHGDPYHLRDDAEAIGEFTFEQRWRLAERNVFDPAVAEWNMRDVYRAAEESEKESSVEDYTHVVPEGNPAGRRLDHILVSDGFAVDRCEILNGEGTPADGLDASDHAPVVAEVALE